MTTPSSTSLLRLRSSIVDAALSGSSADSAAPVALAAPSPTVPPTLPPPSLRTADLAVWDVAVLRGAHHRWTAASAYPVPGGALLADTLRSTPAATAAGIDAAVRVAAARAASSAAVARRGELERERLAARPQVGAMLARVQSALEARAAAAAARDAASREPPPQATDADASAFALLALRRVEDLCELAGTGALQLRAREHAAGAAGSAHAGGRTALMLAVSGGHLAATRALLAAGAQPRDETLSGETAAHMAWDGWARTPAVLVEARAAARRLTLLLLRALLEGGADVNQPDGCGRTLLHRAAAHGHDDAAAALLQAGASLEARDGGGRTPAEVAAASGRMEVARLLKAWPRILAARASASFMADARRALSEARAREGTQAAGAGQAAMAAEGIEGAPTRLAGSSSSATDAAVLVQRLAMERTLRARRQVRGDARAAGARSALCVVDYDMELDALRLIRDDGEARSSEAAAEEEAELMALGAGGELAASGISLDMGDTTGAGAAPPRSAPHAPSSKRRVVPPVGAAAVTLLQRRYRAAAAAVTDIRRQPQGARSTSVDAAGVLARGAALERLLLGSPDELQEEPADAVRASVAVAMGGPRALAASHGAPSAASAPQPPRGVTPAPALLKDHAVRAGLRVARAEQVDALFAAGEERAVTARSQQRRPTRSADPPQAEVPPSIVLEKARWVHLLLELSIDPRVKQPRGVVRGAPPPDAADATLQQAPGLGLLTAWPLHAPGPLASAGASGTSSLSVLDTLTRLQGDRGLSHYARLAAASREARLARRAQLLREGRGEDLPPSRGAVGGSGLYQVPPAIIAAPRSRESAATARRLDFIALSAQPTPAAIGSLRLVARAPSRAAE